MQRPQSIQVGGLQSITGLISERRVGWQLIPTLRKRRSPVLWTGYNTAHSTDATTAKMPMLHPTIAPK